MFARFCYNEGRVMYGGRLVMKRLAVFVFTAVLICSACAAECAVFARPNPEFVEWQRRQARDDDSGAARTRSLSADGEASALRDVPPSPADFSYLDGADFSEFIESAAEEFAQGGGAAAARSASSEGRGGEPFPAPLRYARLRISHAGAQSERARRLLGFQLLRFDGSRIF